ncbi:hypothetical protein NUSPORA_00450 [Nucleospora cyclopteri]
MVEAFNKAAFTIYLIISINYSYIKKFLIKIIKVEKYKNNLLIVETEKLKKVKFIG